ncbi:hypothetical protein E4634_02680 [Mangrovimicrobium sediminis]|uniref:DUF4136 domain-containing protein n=1 Tax=Mangrovimicrobium sediminis TaxID=2562682 RepID=A0A4Z0M7Z0_9GAMM|nr:DUF4136 domain-containing protein [Haliea sp. SAOS-164]TGD75793.1 hypothetical protein E4634_02680 [Haliea sp. SAOS-164]
MRPLHLLSILCLPLWLAACSSIETQPADATQFAQGQYKFYTWRDEALKNPQNSSDPIYVMDAVLRREVDAALAEKGYVRDAGRAQFEITYLQAPGILQGVGSSDAYGGIDPIPSARPNRQVNQAMVDNAQALSGVRETHNIALLFNDAGSHDEVWSVLITKIVDSVNQPDPEKMAKAIRQGVRKGLGELPDAR